ncbi:LacI family transcriptional regulator [Mesorhizobium sp. M4B.F.Ca.ET.215.01.1.1]|uniref:LacI family DNA-binding transcriptional regulator n=2 Tax=Phyllobacteriaceae TaxID=69277 RepID=UPI000FCCA7A7|nr:MULTISPECIES: substrate-binding domain-containing protein [Mesorhizobium]MDX8432433.1 substrate-binding domain-containing protein [Mesorhizobium abyssinicae]RVD40652.1 LacI family transcriptional regulator [Mesorhizobium sp. M4B.F.Ca.ET.019.03.1.1]RWA58281.1 MAG: LacI family transcriptional regulator [Mesorhizobium sp.]RWC92966.1 MAG: LacI family transcriptional regulator [Mesorhizobium sp.]TGQ04173.1 LacI family transcriptional regulator [Mesorhizobium sp. M4B.F.Ca.ET.215.01.1.1]
MTTIADVARYAGVSVATVSHVMNRTRHVEPETAERVRAAIAALRYSPNSLARSLRRGETKTIGLLLPDNSNPFFASVARQIEDAGFVAGYTVILCNSDGSAEKEERYLSVLMAKQIDGLIFAGSSDHAGVFSRLAPDVPAVLLDREIHSVHVDSVLVDHDHGGYLAGQYLVGLGHKRIGVIGGPRDSSSSPARLRGFTRALQEAGVDLPASAVVDSDYHFAGGRLAMERLLTQAPDITAVFACNDLMAMGAVTALRSRGLRVPDDMSMIGFDDIPYAVTTWPPLTTIAQPVEKIGTRAVSLLLERVAEPAAHSRREILMPVLVERESCAPLRG